MYRCSECREKLAAPALVLDEYDNEIYRKCGYCGKNAEKAAAYCDRCRAALFSGEQAYEIGDSLYCGNCTAIVEV